MNNHKPPGIRLIYIICIFASLSLKAQKVAFPAQDQSKPKLFSSLPASMEVSKEDLMNVLNTGTQKNQEIKLPLAKGKLSPFTGNIAYAFSQDQQRTITVRSTSFNGAVLTLSAVTDTDGTVSFVGRIFSLQHADAFELQERNSQYLWIKKNLNEMMTD